MTSLSVIAFAQLSAFFDEIGSPLKGEHKQALRSFISVLDRGLNGELPAKYHLLSLDPGMGKTQACVHFLKAWREQGYQPSSSILIGVSTLEEISSFVLAAGLPKEDFGVLTSNADMNALGLPTSRHGDAKVLFTTQQMIRSRTKGKLFADAAAFKYQGRPRTLRLWDESILPSAGVVLRRDDLLGLISPLRPSHPEFVERLEELGSLMGASAAGDLLSIPLGLELPSNLRQSAGAAMMDVRLRAVFDNLQLMVGSEMIAQADERYGVALVGTTPTLPEDIAPIIVVDASGRVRETYKLWEKHRGNLERLPGAGNSFHQLRVHLWKRSSGKDRLRDPAIREEFATAIVELFERDPDGEWLIVTYKDAVEDLKASVKRACDSSQPPNLHWLHWGKHHSTNAFKDVENVIIVGQSTYRQNDYLGLTLAASGLPLLANGLPSTTEINVGEYKHNLLQAICRASVRNASQGIAKPCNAFVITSQGSLERLMEEVFPGCRVTVWKEVATLTPRVAQAIAYIVDQFSDDGTTELAKGSIAAALGISSTNLSTNILSTEPFEDFLSEYGLIKTRTTIQRAPYMFDDIEGGYVHEPTA
jgi:hypothetical protein